MKKDKHSLNRTRALRLATGRNKKHKGTKHSMRVHRNGPRSRRGKRT